MTSTEYRKWTPEEVALLKDRATSSTVQELAQELDRPVKMVRWKLKKLGLTPVDARKFGKGVPVSVWTPERLQYLRDNAQTTPVADMAEHLGVSISSVRAALFDHKIRGRGRNRKHTAEEIERRVAPLRGIRKVDPDVPRECGRCGEIKPVFRYPSEGLQNQTIRCEECRKEERAIRWMALPDDRRKMEMQLSRLRNYSMTVAEFAALLAKQEGCCALCGVVMEPGGSGSRRLCIDHDQFCCPGKRSCGQCVRGLLCHNCNIMVGFLEGFLERGGDTQRIADYLSQ